MKYIAIAITKDDWWVCISKPTTLESAKLFNGCQLANETFAVKTEEEVNNHTKVLR